MTEGMIGVDGAYLRYLVEGNGAAALVIGSAIYYPRTFSERLKQALRLSHVDMRHFAESPADADPRGITLETYIDDIETARIQLGLQKCILVGHSHHGNLALEYAKRHPANVSHLILIGSPPVNVSRTIEAANRYWQDAPDSRKAMLRRKRAHLDADDRESRSLEERFVAQYLADSAKYWFDPAFDAAFLWRGVPVNTRVLPVFRDFFAGDYHLSWNAEAFQVPVLVVMGLHDYAVPHFLWDDCRPTLSNLSYHLFEQSGHTPQLEEAQRFDQVLLDWLASVGKTSQP